MYNILTILRLPNTIYINSFNTKTPLQKQEARQPRQNTQHKYKLFKLHTPLPACIMAIMDHTKVSAFREMRHLSSVLRYPTSMIRRQLHGLYILGSICRRNWSWIRALSIPCSFYLPCSVFRFVHIWSVGLCMRSTWLTGKEGSTRLCFWMTDYERKEILQRYGYLFPGFRRVSENKYMLLFKADTCYIRTVWLLLLE